MIIQIRYYSGIVLYCNSKYSCKNKANIASHLYFHVQCYVKKSSIKFCLQFSMKSFPFLINKYSDKMHKSQCRHMKWCSIHNPPILLKCWTMLLSIHVLRQSFVWGIRLASMLADCVSGKPAIANRDLKSKNILVKSNNTCCIADLGK